MPEVIGAKSSILLRYSYSRKLKIRQRSRSNLVEIIIQTAYSNVLKYSHNSMTIYTSV